MRMSDWSSDVCSSDVWRPARRGDNVCRRRNGSGGIVRGALMKALLSTIPGGPETLELRDVPIPDPAAGELRVRVLACALNYPDVLIIEDRYQFKTPRDRQCFG